MVSKMTFRSNLEARFVKRGKEIINKIFIDIFFLIYGKGKQVVLNID